MKTIIICGGGTLGHIMPGIAFSKRLKQENTKIVFITGVKDKRFDEFINSGKIDEIYYYDVCGLSRKNPFKNILGFFTNNESFFKIKQLFNAMGYVEKTDKNIVGNYSFSKDNKYCYFGVGFSKALEE